MNNKKQKGLSLIELLVGMVLSLIIIGGIIQVFLANRQAFNMSQSMVRVQESGRFAVSFISEAIRESGGYGCVPSLNNEGNNIRSWAGSATDVNAIQTTSGWTNSADGTDNDTGDPDDPFDDPDSLSLLQLTSNESVITSVINGNTVQVSGDGDFEGGDLVLISNCEVADIVDIAAGGVAGDEISVDTLNLRTDFFEQANKRSTVAALQHLAFTIVDENLTVSVNGGAAQEVVSGIENMQFTYGVDLDGDLVADYFDDLSNIPADDVENIAAVTVSILAVSGTFDEGAVEDVTTEFQTITFDGDSTLMDDTRHRTVFSSTVALRNRMN